MSDNTNAVVTRHHFETIVTVAAELFGESHATTVALRDLLSSASGDAIDRGMALVRALPQVHRDNILGHAKNRLRDDAQFQEWLMKRLGQPTDIPLDRNIQ